MSESKSFYSFKNPIKTGLKLNIKYKILLVSFVVLLFLPNLTHSITEELNPDATSHQIIDLYEIDSNDMVSLTFSDNMKFNMPQQYYRFTNILPGIFQPKKGITVICNDIELRYIDELPTGTVPFGEKFYHIEKSSEWSSIIGRLYSKTTIYFSDELSFRELDCTISTILFDHPVESIG